MIINKQGTPYLQNKTRRFEMNKLVISIVIVAVIGIALGTAGFVYAQSTTPPATVPGTGTAYGRMNGQGGRGGMMGSQGMRGGMAAQNNTGTQDGLLHDEMIAVFAEELGISADDLNARLAAGETMVQIAASTGLTAEQFSALMIDVRGQAIDQAVKNGTLTQEQADWMKQRGAGQAMGGGRGMRGTGQGLNADMDCPYYPQTNP
jgi:hypothetical protein